MKNMEHCEYAPWSHIHNTSFSQVIFTVLDFVHNLKFAQQAGCSVQAFPPLCNVTL
jgi:hypothetical protein